jgi:DNA repair exonuclease SbcCD ATPase subunit
VLENEKKMLEATIRIFEERCREEGQERRRLAELCAKFKAEGRDRNDGDKVVAENRNLEALHETLNSEIERLGQNISALKRKVREDEQRRLDLQNKNTRQEQQIAVLLGENERIKSLQESAPRETNSVTPASGTPNIPEVVLSCLPGKLGQTLGTHIESREFQNTPNFWLL